MSNNTELIDKESLDKIVADIKAILKRTSLDALNSVQWEFNQRYLFGNEVDKPLIKSGKLFTKEGPVAKGAIWTSLDTGKLWMNTGSGWKNIGGLNNINKPDLIEVFHPRTDYPVEETVSVTDLGGEQWIPYPFKKYERYAVTKSQSPFTCFLCRAAARDNITQDIRTLFGSAASTNQFTCMVDDAKYFGFTTGSSSNLVNIDIVDLGSALEPIKDSNMQAGWHIYPFPIEKGKTYYWTKTALSIWFGYGDRKNDTEWIEGTQVQVHYGGDSGAGTWSFKAEKDATGVGVLIGANTVLESFEFKGEDLPDYKLTYPYVTRSANDKPENPKVGDMIFDSYQAGTSGSPLWWNGTAWVDAKASASLLATTDRPATANEGTIYYDTDENNLKIFYNGEWRDAIEQYKVLPNTTTAEEANLLKANGRSLYIYYNGSWQLIQGSAAYIAGTTVDPGFIRAGVRVNTNTNYLLVGGKDKWAFFRLREREEQVVTFTNNAGETIVAIECERIIVTASFGSVSILDFTDINKEEGKTIEINILASSIIRVKDGATEKDLTDCNGSIVKAICLSNVWHFYKVSGITEIV